MPDLYHPSTIFSVEIAVLHLDGSARYLGSVVCALHKAVAESVDGRIVARSAADKAELCITLGNGGIARKIAALLLHEGDCSDIRESFSVAVRKHISVNKDKLRIGILRSGALESLFLLVAGSDDYLCAAAYSLNESIVSVVIRGLIAVSRLIIFI